MEKPRPLFLATLLPSNYFNQGINWRASEGFLAAISLIGVVSVVVAVSCTSASSASTDAQSQEGQQPLPLPLQQPPERTYLTFHS